MKVKLIRIPPPDRKQPELHCFIPSNEGCPPEPEPSPLTRELMAIKPYFDRGEEPVRHIWCVDRRTLGIIKLKTRIAPKKDD